MFGKQYLQLHYSEVDDLCQWVIDSREAYRMGAKLNSCGRRDATISVKPNAEMRKEEDDDHEEGSDNVEKELAHVQDCTSPEIDLNSSKLQERQVRKEGCEDPDEGGNKAAKEGKAHVQDCKSPVIDLNTYSSKPQEEQKIWTMAGGVTLYETDRYME